MILIVTHRNDYTADFLINKLNSSKIQYVRYNCEDVLKSPFTIKLDKQIDYSLIDNESFKSVWFRRTKYPELSGITLPQRAYLLNEIDSFHQNLFSIITGKWVSDPFNVYKAENKLFQLKIALQCGFTIPNTIISNQHSQIRDFFETSNNNIVIKPISLSRIHDPVNPKLIFTNKVPKTIINTLNKFDLTPVIFQENIEKDYEIRITVVGEKVFAAKVYSQTDNETKIDWRRKKLDFTIAKIPDDISNKCIDLVKRLGLKFGAIDMIKTKTNKYIFLEINPNGQWAWIEIETGMPICNAIISELDYE